MFLDRVIKKIDFLVVGAQKSGTTALDKYLRQHEEIGMANYKELHFFDNENIFSKARPKVWRHRHYYAYSKSFDFSLQKVIYGEITPIYMYWEPSCERIWQYNKNIKLIFILRNPIQRAFSHWHMEYDKNAEKEDFSFCIRNEHERMKEALPYQHKVYSYVDRGFYSQQIRRFKKLFNNDQMLFIKYEQFNNNQEQKLNEIFDFLGVNKDLFEYEHKVVHKRERQSQVAQADKQFLIEKFTPDIRQLEKDLNWDCSDWLD